MCKDGWRRTGESFRFGFGLVLVAAPPVLGILLYLLEELNVELLWYVSAHLLVSASTLAAIGAPAFCNCPKEDNPCNVDAVGMEFARLFLWGMVVVHGVSAVYFLQDLNRRSLFHAALAGGTAISISFAQDEVFSEAPQPLNAALGFA